jgi:hypothetical protein
MSLNCGHQWAYCSSPQVIYICEYEQPWWTDIDRRKLVIHPPELSGNSANSNRVAKQEEIKEILNVAYKVCL